MRKEFDEVNIHTGQHYDYQMDNIIFDVLKILDYHLGVGSGSHREQTAEMLKRTEEDVDIAAMHLKKTLEELA